MDKIVQCVPNFSEGKDRDTIRAICTAARNTGVGVLSIESDADFHRSVLTFVSDPETIVEGAYAVIQACAEKIDMQTHSGEHPRMGACDVTPFVPVAGVTLDDCALLAHTLGKRVGEQLHLPVYLYGAAARPGRQDLGQVRKGQYEGLEKKLQDPAWAPDFGPAEFRPRFGAPLIGARPFLIAYNVNLETDDVKAADQIARRVRTSGERIDGTRVPGLLDSVKGLGVLLKERNIAQVSMNLTDFSLTNMHRAFEAVKAEARKLGRRVTGSEIVGLVPQAAIVESGRHYGGASLPEKQAVVSAIKNLGLDDIEPFDPEKKILEWVLAAPAAGDPCQD